MGSAADEGQRIDGSTVSRWVRCFLPALAMPISACPPAPPHGPRVTTLRPAKPDAVVGMLARIATHHLGQHMRGHGWDTEPGGVPLACCDVCRPGARPQPSCRARCCAPGAETRADRGQLDPAGGAVEQLPGPDRLPASGSVASAPVWVMCSCCAALLKLPSSAIITKACTPSKSIFMVCRDHCSVASRACRGRAVLVLSQRAQAGGICTSRSSV